MWRRRRRKTWQERWGEPTPDPGWKSCLVHKGPEQTLQLVELHLYKAGQLWPFPKMSLRHCDVPDWLWTQKQDKWSRTFYSVLLKFSKIRDSKIFISNRLRQQWQQVSGQMGSYSNWKGLGCGPKLQRETPNLSVRFHLVLFISLVKWGWITAARTELLDPPLRNGSRL